jgi:hypothetical protein
MIKSRLQPASTEAKRREHQIELAKQKQIEGIARFEGKLMGLAERLNLRLKSIEL